MTQIVKAKEVSPGAYFVEERRLPGSSTKEGEMRQNFFKRTRRKGLLTVNGIECVEVLAYGFVQEDRVYRLSKRGVKCRLIAGVPVKEEHKKRWPRTKLPAQE